MTERRNSCSECGRELPPEAEGVCPACLIRRGLEPLDEGLPATQPALSSTPPPTVDRIGPYRVIRRIGEGGMGVVYLARQEGELKRDVAIKRIKYGVDSKAVLARFDVERQALAMLDHPGIARAIDAGTTDRGEPYFVMEYVDGEPVTDYCDRKRLSTRARLELFVQICDAVEHAHRRGVIHRDLKPSNILIAETDDGPQPKVIDFGVAKATSQRRLEWSVFTELGQLVGTPEYMSPEQADTTGFDIDTRTDVFSLGIVLYELLVGQTPLGADTLREAGLAEMLREIRETDVPALSDRLSTLGDQAGRVAEARSTDRAALLRDLRGEVEWIVMRAVEKDRERRFGSPRELAEDIQRYLEDLPVRSGPPSTTYRMRKFVRRHRIGVAVAAASLAVLLAFTALTVVQAKRLERERDQVRLEAETARRTSDFMAELFRISKPSESRGQQVTARELLDRGARQIQDDLDDQTELRARLLTVMGNAYRGLGLLDRAAPLLEQALDLRRTADEPTRLKATVNVAGLYASQARYDEAEPMLVDAVERFSAILGDADEATLTARGELARLYLLQGKYDRTLEEYEAVHRIRLREHGPDHPDTLAAQDGLATAYTKIGRHEESIEIFEEIHAIRRRARGEDHPETLKSMANLAGAMVPTGRDAEAEELFERALELQTRVLGPDHPDTLRTQGNLAQLYLKGRRFDEAEPMLQANLEAKIRVLGPDHPDAAFVRQLLAGAYAGTGRFAEAEPLFDEVVATHVRLLGPDHLNTRVASFNQAYVYMQTGRTEEAREIYESIAEFCDRVLEPEHDFCQANQRALGSFGG